MSYTDSTAYPVIPSTEGVSSTGIDAGSTFTNGGSDAYSTTTSRSAKKNVKETFAQGPVAENVKAEATKTSNELSALSAKRQTPATRTATGQHLTHYHSFFGSLFSWENPRASALAYAATVVFIFAARYLDLLRYALKLTWMALGVTVAAEVAGRALFNSGFTSQIRPRKYYTLPKATLDSMTGDIDELINFFVIESQRLLFAENVLASGAALFSAFLSYHLVKIVPLWGLALIGTSVLFLGPLVYKTNQALIDGQIEQLSKIVNDQTTQVRQMASQHASNAAATTKMYVGDYSAKAQEIIGRARSSSPVARKSETPVATTGVTSSKVPATSASSLSPSSTSTKKSKSKSKFAETESFPTTTEESFPKVPATESFSPSTSAVPEASFSPSTTSTSSSTIPAATLPTYTIPPPGAAMKTEGLDAASASAAADGASDLRFEDFPAAPKKVVSVGEDGLVRESVPSVGGFAAGLREELS
ncbi:hypothetical protein V495_06684 [Pseudogymnoascus sp. VKM F-4514 (FW-929)]|nr:hypothetical protein V495_06684 [Pseudogymnoascus sp. VKM F-4514 (FW-929)]KFY60858.1 hypothetical protein V497_03341 [Pseudogymnoascus sp. VKM F-4516 (FW-969)]